MLKNVKTLWSPCQKYPSLPAFFLAYLNSVTSLPNMMALWLFRLCISLLIANVVKWLIIQTTVEIYGHKTTPYAGWFTWLSQTLDEFLLGHLQVSSGSLCGREPPIEYACLRAVAEFIMLTSFTNTKRRQLPHSRHKDSKVPSQIDH